MTVRDVYLKIQLLNGYSPVAPADHVTPPQCYRRDCMRGPGHEDGCIPADEVNARRVNALIYREYLDAQYLVPKPDKLVAADINEPAYQHRVPGTVIYAHPGERLKIHVKNGDVQPHSFHVHGLSYGIDSDGSWPFGTQSSDGRRSDEICPGQAWTYTYDVTDEMLGAWPFHSHCRAIAADTNRGLFGGIVVLPAKQRHTLPTFELPTGFVKDVLRIADGLRPKPGVPLEVTKPPFAPIPPVDARPAAMPMQAMMAMPMPMAGAAAMPMPIGEAHHGVGGLPIEIQPAVATLEELASARAPIAGGHDEVLHVPLFLHQMSGTRSAPVFASAPLNPGQQYAMTFSAAGVYDYICGVHGSSMNGRVRVQVGGPATGTVSTPNLTFADSVSGGTETVVGVGGVVTWTNTANTQHSVVESGGASLASFCFNGRSFIGNTPTIVARSGQRIRWYVFNLDLGMNWHNFHPHAQRWQFAGQPVDIRSIGPAESFVVETVAPPVVLLPESIAAHQAPGKRRRTAKPYDLRGDFLVHCHVEMHMMEGLAALVRARQQVWLTRAEAKELQHTTGLPIDHGDNDCPGVRPNRCGSFTGGRVTELPGDPEITFMHAILLPRTNRILYWGYGPRPDQSRLWDQDTGLYTQPANQPAALSPDQDIWSGAHAHLADGTILGHGGFYHDPVAPMTADTERRSFTFDTATSMWSKAADKHVGRFYPTTISLADGRALTLFGEDNAHARGRGVQSFEVYSPGPGGGSWSAPKALPFNYYYYPWTFLLPLGDLFIAGPQKPARRFDPNATPIVDVPANQYNQVYPQRGVNMEGTAVLLPLRAPTYRPRVFIAGGTDHAGLSWDGSEAGALATAEWIDLSAPAPAWQALPDMNVPRAKLNSVLLPDGRILIVGGWENPPDGGPIELFDPENPSAGFELGPNVKYPRGYHSCAVLMPDGSVIIGGDPNTPGPSEMPTPHERYEPSYFFKPRPQIGGAPATITHNAPLAIQTPDPSAIGEVILMRPAAVTHAFNHNQRSISCTITGGSGGEIHATTPPDGNVAPRGYYLLFLVDHMRVPSEGRWIHLT